MYLLLTVSTSSSVKYRSAPDSSNANALPSLAFLLTLEREPPNVAIIIFDKCSANKHTVYLLAIVITGRRATTVSNTFASRTRGTRAGRADHIA